MSQAGDTNIRVTQETSDILTEFRTRTGRFQKELAGEAIREYYRQVVGPLPEKYRDSETADVAGDGMAETEPSAEQTAEVTEQAAQTPGFNL